MSPFNHEFLSKTVKAHELTNICFANSSHIDNGNELTLHLQGPEPSYSIDKIHISV